jgi:tetratricopeptide (TPR) repeat protein
MNKLCLLVFSVLFLIGCRENYKAEKEFWKAEQTLQSLRNSGQESRGPEVLEPAIKAYERVVELYPESYKASEALFAMANLKIRQRKLEDARELLTRVIQQSAGMETRALEARYGIAQLYEVEGNWEKAEEAYWDALDHHPINPKALYAPVHVIIHYKKIQDQQGEMRAYKKAMDYYESKYNDMGPIRASAGLRNYQAMATLAHGDWKKACELWLAIPEKFPDSSYAPMALLAAGEIYWKRRQADIADGIYETFLKQYPKHNLAPKTEVQLGAMYLDQKKYQKSRDWFTLLLEKTKEPEQVAEIKLLLARTYQDEGNADQAFHVYKEIHDQYALTNAGLQVPLLMAKEYQDSNRTSLADQTLDEAIKQYKELEKQERNEDRKNFIKKLHNQALMQKGDWQSLMANYEQSMTEEKSPLRKGSWLFLQALVTESRIKDPEKAESLYKDFLSQYPNHPLASSAKTRLGQGLVHSSQQIAPAV